MIRFSLCVVVSLLALAAAVSRGGGSAASAYWQSNSKPTYVLSKPENFEVSTYPGLYDDVKQNLRRDFGIQADRVEIKNLSHAEPSSLCAGISSPCDVVKFTRKSECNPRCVFQVVVVRCSKGQWDKLDVHSDRVNLNNSIARMIKTHEIRYHERRQ